MVVRGRVQGVGFRWAVVQAAETRGAAGWVCNRDDGSVEAVFEGGAEAVDSLVRFCGEGPRGAEVTGVDVVAEAPEGLARFEVR